MNVAEHACSSSRSFSHRVYLARKGLSVRSLSRRCVARSSTRIAVSGKEAKRLPPRPGRAAARSTARPRSRARAASAEGSWPAASAGSPQRLTAARACASGQVVRQPGQVAVDVGHEGVFLLRRTAPLRRPHQGGTEADVPGAERDRPRFQPPGLSRSVTAHERQRAASDLP